MDSWWIILLLIAAVAAIYLYNRNRTPPAGTYDDKNTRSSGSIGGGTRAHDSPDVRSGGSIGGGAKTYDSPDHESSGSIGGQPVERTVRPARTPVDRTPPPARTPVDRTAPPVNNRAEDSGNVTQYPLDYDAEDDELDEEQRPKHDDKDFRSGGSFG